MVLFSLKSSRQSTLRFLVVVFITLIDVVALQSNKNTPVKKILQIGYITGAQQHDRSDFYKKPGRLFSGAITTAVDEVNKYKMLPDGYELNFTYVETYGTESLSIANTAKFVVNKEVSAIIGPQETCYTESQIASAYNIPMLSYYCTDYRVTEVRKAVRKKPDELIYRTFARTKPQESQIGNAVAAFLIKYNWTKITLVNSNSAEIKRMAAFIKASLKKNNIKIQFHEVYSAPYIHMVTKNPFRSIVQKTYTKTRIYVVVGSYMEPYGLALNLNSRGLLDTGQYFVLGIDNEYYDPDRPERYVSDYILYKSEAVTNERRKRIFSFRSYLQITLMGFKQSSNLRTFAQSVNDNMERKPFDFKKTVHRIQLKPEAGYLYDAVMLYAKAAGHLLRNGKKASDGKAVFNYLKGKEYNSILGFKNRLNNDGDCEGNYTVLQLEELNENGRDVTEKYGLMPIGMFVMSQNLTSLPTFKILKDKKINWLSGKAPLDEPTCGFEGEKCIPEVNYVKEILGGVLGIVILLVTIISVFVHRSRKFERELQQLQWKIELRDVKMTDVCVPLQPHTLAGQGQLKSSHSTSSLESIEGGEEGTRLVNGRTDSGIGGVINRSFSDMNQSKLFTAVGVFKGQMVAVKSVRTANIHLNRRVKKELKTLRDLNHANLTKFVGACIEQPKICVVWEYCARGSLQDILGNEEISLEPMFITSLVFDIINAMVFLHDSDIRYNGNLKSSNCVVDSRWTLKLTDFNLEEFKSGESLAGQDESTFFSGLLWTSPELLRYEILRKPKFHNNTHFVNLLEDMRKDGDVPNDATFEMGVTSMQRADVYAFAIILFEMHSRVMPFQPNNHGPREIIKRIVVVNKQFNIPYRPKLSQISNVEKLITDCISVCWSEDPLVRPSFKQIRQRLKPMQAGMTSNIFDNMMNLMESYAKNLERLVSDRTEKLIEEKKKTEELLYQMLPLRVAEQLKRGKPVEAECFDCATIYFSDICGFTNLCSDSTPIQVVQTLGDLYNAFDAILKEFEVYKVETIGDAYMVASGLPERNDYHAAEIAGMSLRLLAEIRNMKIRHRPNETLRLRIGIHSGACCAGVVGTAMPRYCLFGDTVNYASRMESTGEPFKIHCSEPCKEELDKCGGFILQERGKIEVKGKGTLRTFWLSGTTKGDPRTTRPSTTSTSPSPLPSSPVNQEPELVQDCWEKMNSTDEMYSKKHTDHSSESYPVLMETAT